MLKTRGVKSSKRKSICYKQGNPLRLPASFSAEAATQKAMVWYIQSAKRKTCQPSKVVLQNWRRDKEVSTAVKMLDITHKMRYKNI